MNLYDARHSGIEDDLLSSKVEGKTKTSDPQSGEGFLAGVPDWNAVSDPGTPLSVYQFPTIDTLRNSPCEWACGNCTQCRVFDAIRNLAA